MNLHLRIDDALVALSRCERVAWSMWYVRKLVADMQVTPPAQVSLDFHDWSGGGAPVLVSRLDLTVKRCALGAVEILVGWPPAPVDDADVTF